MYEKLKSEQETEETGNNGEETVEEHGDTGQVEARSMAEGVGAGATGHEGGHTHVNEAEPVPGSPLTHEAHGEGDAQTSETLSGDAELKISVADEHPGISMIQE